MSCAFCSPRATGLLLLLVGCGEPLLIPAPDPSPTSSPDDDDSGLSDGSRWVNIEMSLGGAALREDGEVDTWGVAPDDGGKDPGSSLPVPPPGPYESIAVSGFSFCGIRRGGELDCVGDGSNYVSADGEQFRQFSSCFVC